MKKTAALVLAGGQMGDYGVLTQNRAKGALTFAGFYRIIDFAMSNLVNSGIDQIGLIIQYLPGSLIEHVGSGKPWDLDNYGKHLKIMPPFVGMAHTAWYKGTADAIFQNINFIRELHSENVIILSGEHAFHLDFRAVLEAHHAHEADITIVTAQVPPERFSRRFGYVEVNDEGRVTAYHEKPAQPPSDLVSTGIYIFRTETLIKYLTANAAEQEHNLPKDVLQKYAAECRTFEYRHTGCWEYLENLRDYYDAHYRLMEGGVFDQLRQWNLQTNLKFRNIGHAPPAIIGPAATVEGSMISPGCNIQGTVINSILSPGVKVAAGATVSNSILMHDCTVDTGSRVDYVISDRDVTIGQNATIGIIDGQPVDGTPPPLTLLGKGCLLGDAVVIPPGTQIRPGKHLPTQEAANLEI